MSLKSHWRALKDSVPGTRCKEFYDRKQEERKSGRHPLSRIVHVGIGIALAVSGVVFLAIPGPGLLIIALGLGLVAGEFEFMARLLDRLEVRIRAMIDGLKHRWQTLRPYQRVICIATGVLVLCGGAACLYGFFM